MLVERSRALACLHSRRTLESAKEMRFRSVLNTHQPQSDTLYTMRNENARDWECAGQGALVLQTNKEEALVSLHPIHTLLATHRTSLSTSTDVLTAVAWRRPEVEPPPYEGRGFPTRRQACEEPAKDAAEQEEVRVGDAPEQGIH
jgi:hypothetical protein